jgi:hypothetical protein
MLYLLIFLVLSLVIINDFVFLFIETNNIDLFNYMCAQVFRFKHSESKYEIKRSISCTKNEYVDCK